MNEKRYSIIIPIYNAEKTLRRCIDSILTENNQNLEIILVNDGSTDLSWKICSLYAKEYQNIVVIDKTNGGAASARNTGLEQATGKYILFADSDDVILPGYFSILDKIGDSDFVVFGIEKSTGEKAVPQNCVDAVSYIANTRDGALWNKRFKNEIIKQEKIEFPSDLTVGEDYIFCLKYSLHCKTTKYIEQVLYYYDISGVGSLTRKYRPDYIEQALLIYKYAFESLENVNMEIQKKEKLNATLDYNYCRTAFACATIPIKYRKVMSVSKELKRILKNFSINMRESNRTISIAHNIMRFCIKNHIYCVMYMIATIKK